jgi:hypothetical protein
MNIRIDKIISVKQVTLIAMASLLTLMSACSNQSFKGEGQYLDASGKKRNISLEYKAKVYYIPFINADVDYGSISLTAECLTNSLRDTKVDKQFGLVFIEPTQYFEWGSKQPKLKIGRHLVCAKFINNHAISTAGNGDNVRLQTFCSAKSPSQIILPVNDQGYNLVIKEITEKDSVTASTPANVSACSAQ